MRLSRGGWALCTLAGASVAMLGPGAGRAWHDLASPSFPTALTGLACLVQLAIAIWVVVAVALVLVRAPGPLVRAVAPRVLRQAVLAGTAGALVITPACADPAAAPHGAPAPHDLVGLHLPDRPSGSVPPAAGTGSQPVTIRSGDTLWAISARSLPDSATDSEIAVACARWYVTNRAVIGADPDLIFPGQHLTPPLGKDPA